MQLIPLGYEEKGETEARGRGSQNKPQLRRVDEKGAKYAAAQKGKKGQKEMRQIFVNEIIEGENVTHGYAAYEETVIENLRTIFTQRELWEMIESIDNLPGDYGNTLLRFCQFIVYLSFHKKPKLSFGMVIIDCHADVDAALDEYLMYGQHNWDQESKDRFMRLFQEIEDDLQTDRAVMTIWNDPRLS